MKRFWLKILLLVPLPIIVIGFNWFVDPVHLRHAGQYEHGIAQLILDDHRVTNILNPNEEAYIKFIVDGSKTRKDVLVFGSSRSKLIHADSFPGLSLFNNSIGGAGLVDYLAIYRMYRQKQLLPSIAVIELSPWILMRDYSSVWKTLNASKQELENQLSLTASQKTPPFQTHSSDQVAFSEFLSLGYFQTSFCTWADQLFRPSTSSNTYFVWQDGTPRWARHCWRTAVPCTSNASSTLGTASRSLLWPSNMPRRQGAYPPPSTSTAKRFSTHF